MFPQHRFGRFLRHLGEADVAGLGDPHGIPWSAVPGNWQDIALGLNYRPGRNVTCRTEVRWDWYNGPPNPAGELPFGDLAHTSQFTTGLDLLFTF